MQELILMNKEQIVVQVKGKIYQESASNFLSDYSKPIEYNDIDYNRDTQSCWLNGQPFQKYPDDLCEDILNSIDILLAKKEERDYVEPTPPTEAEIQKCLTDGVQNWMDSKVHERNYDNVHTCVGTYLYSPIEKFRLEAEAVRDWVSYVWAKCYEILAQVEAGERDIPTLEEVISELPVLVW